MFQQTYLWSDCLTKILDLFYMEPIKRGEPKTLCEALQTANRQGLFLDIVVNKEGDVVLYIKSWKLVYRGFQVCRIQWWIVSSWKISQNLSKWRLDSRWPPKSRVWISKFSKNHWELSFCLIFKIFAPKSFKKIVVFTKKYLKNLGWC